MFTKKHIECWLGCIETTGMERKNLRLWKMDKKIIRIQTSNRMKKERMRTTQKRKSTREDI
jgi:hypothetical protein